MKQKFNLFRSVSVFALVLLMSAGASADTLSDVMKQMGMHFKILSVFVMDSSKNQESLSSARELAVYIEQAKQFTPETILELPVAEQAGAQARYVDLLEQLLKADQQLIAALEKGDQALAIESLKKMDGLRKEGHGEFK